VAQGAGVVAFHLSVVTL